MKRMLFGVLLSFAAAQVSAQTERPSRAPVKGCQWEKMSDAKVGLTLWAQRCDFGFRKIDPLFKDGSFAIVYSDGGGPQKLIDVIAQLPGETAPNTSKFQRTHALVSCCSLESARMSHSLMSRPCSWSSQATTG